MRVTVDGQPFDVPDDATPEEIDQISRPAQPPGKAEAMLRGGAQGATLGFMDELAGAGTVLRHKLLPPAGGVDRSGEPIAPMYTQARDEYRAADKAARQAHPNYYTGSEVAGGVLPLALSGGGLGTAIATGGLSGAGYSDADSAGGLARDIGIGGAGGAAGYGAGAVLGKAVSAAGRYASGKVAGAASRAAAKATEQEGGKVADVARSFGGESQKGSRLLENAVRLEPSMTAQEAAQLAAQRQSGAVQDLERQVTQSTLGQLPTQAATIAAKRAELASAQQALPQAIAARTAELQKPTFFSDAASFAKSYAEPFIASQLAGKAADALGLDRENKARMELGAGLIFARTRAGKALADRINKPGNQMTMWGAAKSLSPIAEALLRKALQSGATGPLTEAAVAP